MQTSDFIGRNAGLGKERRLDDGGPEPDPRPAPTGAPGHGNQRPGGKPAGGRNRDARREEHEGRDAKSDR